MRLRYYPSLLLLYAGGVACISAGKYETLASLLTETKIQQHRTYTDSVIFNLVPLRVLSADDQKYMASSFSQSLRLNAHLLDALTPILGELIYSEKALHDAFLRFEYLFALMVKAQDGGSLRGLFNTESELLAGYQKYGKATIPIAAETDQEINQLGSEWPALKHGLFTGPLQTFKEFKASADEALLKRGSEALFA
jgi:hypothetical protein